MRRKSPFGSPVAVLGSMTLYLSLLICSSLYYRDNRDRRNRDRAIITSQYAIKNSLMALALCMGMGLGAICGIAGLTNTAITFCVLWLVEKYCKVHVENRW